MLGDEDVAELRRIGDNTGSMALKGAAPGFDGDAAADRWPLDEGLSESPVAGASSRTRIWSRPPESACRWMGVAVRLTLLAGILLLALAGTASAHGRQDDHIDTRRELGVGRHRQDGRDRPTAGPSESGGLPTTWCGTQRTTDDITNNAFNVSLPQFKVVYAYPVDGANRVAQWVDALQADVSLIGRFMGEQSGGRKAPRFDMGTNCGAAYVDIEVVALPSPRAYYRGDEAFSRLETDVIPRVDLVGRPAPERRRGRRHAVRVLRPATGTASAPTWSDESPGQGNWNNEGGVFAALFVPEAMPAPGGRADGWWPEGMLHEMTHNLGARRRERAARDAVRALHRRLRRHVLRRRLRPVDLRADQHVPEHHRRDGPGLRLRRRRLLQRRAARGQLPGDALERLRQRLPRRLHGASRPPAAARAIAPSSPVATAKPEIFGIASGGRPAHRDARHMDQRAGLLRLQVGARRWRDVDAAGRDAARATRRPSPTSVSGCGCA